MANPQAFVINRYDNILRASEAGLGANLLTNSSFENGTLSGWAADGFSAVTATSVGIEQIERYGDYVARGATSQHSRSLLSDRVSVTAGTTYQIKFAYGAGVDAELRLNNLRVQVLWYNALSGGSQIGKTKLVRARIHNSGQWNTIIVQATAPIGAVAAAIRVRSAILPESLVGLTGASMTSVDAFTMRPFVAVSRPTPIETLYHLKLAGQGFAELNYATNARVGFKEASFALYGEPDYLWWWVERALIDHIEIVYQGRRFEGYVSRMSGNIEGQPIDYSTDNLFNDIFIEGAEGVLARSPSADSIERYGRKMFADSDSHLKTATALKGRSDYVMKRFRHPRNANPFGVSSGIKNVLQLTITGYMQTLDWIERVVISEQFGGDISDMIATGAGVAYMPLLNQVRAVWGNVFISDDYSEVEDTGHTIRWENGFQRSNALELVMELLDMGDSNQKFICSGVWEDRKFHIHLLPTTVGYQRLPSVDGNDAWLDAGGAPIAKALVRAGEFVQTARRVTRAVRYNDLWRDPATPFLYETQYQTETDELTPIPLDQETLERGIAAARVRKR